MRPDESYGAKRGGGSIVVEGMSRYDGNGGSGGDTDYYCCYRRCCCYLPKHLSADLQKFQKAMTVTKATIINEKNTASITADTHANDGNEKLKQDHIALNQSAVNHSDDVPLQHETEETSVISAALVTQLGAFSFWRGDTIFMDAMEQIYQNTSKTDSCIFGKSR